ncbi:MAG TPA: DUF3105 domain-containing protein [Nocardioidaceae bacterium]|nr:DUF3105 domain-containing protein [Nocardioidaceae bacterium]
MITVLRPVLVTGALLAALAACTDDAPPAAGAIGASRAEAGCQPVVTKDFVTPANGTHHLADDSPLTWDEAPPAAALHHGFFPETIKNIYQVTDRPTVSDMVHMTEHGYNIVWYDETIGGDDAAMDDLAAIADEYPVGEYLTIAPWTTDDGPAFPGDGHVALTHWTGPEDMQGVWEYCGKVSGEVVDAFTSKYTKANSPEPTAP